MPVLSDTDTIDTWACTFLVYETTDFKLRCTSFGRYVGREIFIGADIKPMHISTGIFDLQQMYKIPFGLEIFFFMKVNKLFETRLFVCDIN